MGNYDDMTIIFIIIIIIRRTHLFVTVSAAATLIDLTSFASFDRCLFCSCAAAAAVPLSDGPIAQPQRSITRTALLRRWWQPAVATVKESVRKSPR